MQSHITYLDVHYTPLALCVENGLILSSCNVQFTPEQAMKSQRGCRGIAERHTPVALSIVPNVQQAGWVSGQVWTVAKNFAHIRIRSLDPPARSYTDWVIPAVWCNTLKCKLRYSVYQIYFLMGECCEAPNITSILCSINGFLVCCCWLGSDSVLCEIREK
jgi:hypothetical protein